MGRKKGQAGRTERCTGPRTGPGLGAHQRGPKARAWAITLLLAAGLTACGGGGSGGSDPVGEDTGLQANFRADPPAGSAPLAVSFTDLSTGEVTAWEWEFGDGNRASTRLPVHTYSSEGTYSVALTVRGPEGQSRHAVAGLVRVGGPPQAAWEGAEWGLAPAAVQFLDRSSGGITSWSWEFGDGARSNARHPQHTYRQPGNYAVRLTVGGPTGTDRSAPRTVRIEAAPPNGFALTYGMNPSFQRWSEPGLPFSDLMTRAHEFSYMRAGNVDQNEPAPVIPPGRVGAGWPDFARIAPGESVGVKLLQSPVVPDGMQEPYVVRWEGTGSCRLFGPHVVTEVERGAQHVHVRVKPSNPNGVISLEIQNSNPADPVRNVHVWLPGTAEEQPLLWPPYLAKVLALQGGRGPSSWRTLDWNRINDYGSGAFRFDFEGRITPASPSQGTARGVCPEFQVALCNATGSDLHFQVPHRTDALSVADYERYVRDVLTRIRDGSGPVPGIHGGRPFAGLDPELDLVLEYSNELWNSDFPAYHWIRAQAAQRGIDPRQQIAEELAAVVAIAEEVFAAGRERLKIFVGGHRVVPTFAGRILDYLEQRFGPGGFPVDALGPAGYLGPAPTTIQGWNAGSPPDADELLSAMLDILPGIESDLLAHRVLCDTWTNPDGSRPELVLYEAGASLVPNGAPWGAAAAALQSSPAMYFAYVDHLIPTFVAGGVESVVWYSFMTRVDQVGFGVGSFGHWNSMDQTLELPIQEADIEPGSAKAAALYRLPPSRP